MEEDSEFSFSFIDQFLNDEPISLPLGFIQENPFDCFPGVKTPPSFETEMFFNDLLDVSTPDSSPIEAIQSTGVEPLFVIDQLPSPASPPHIVENGKKTWPCPHCSHKCSRKFD
eukprot:TRINITY_DN20043_c0_g1_i1.p1 TRINITY_DN20043_c0_g1~~TRINITY_DN20043_c0_g1_i1.p1  ORF type:complete len:114 (+),score=10.08 TRINITY_DN20043_c0_g1_i1:55-396(+)